MSDQANNDDPVNAVSLEQQVEIRVGEPTRTPVLRRDDIAGLRLELLSDLATPRSVFKGLRRERRLLNRRDVLPLLVIARPIPTMQHIEDMKSRFSRGL